jgi:hypothetical protein
MIGVMASGGIARQALGVRKKWRIHTRLSWALTVAIATHIGTIFASHYHGWTVAYATAIGWGTVARQTAVIATWLLLVVLVTTARHQPSSLCSPLSTASTQVAPDTKPTLSYQASPPSRSSPPSSSFAATTNTSDAGSGLLRLQTQHTSLLHHSNATEGGGTSEPLRPTELNL